MHTAAQITRFLGFNFRGSFFFLVANLIEYSQTGDIIVFNQDPENRPLFQLDSVAIEALSCYIKYRVAQ